MTENIGVKIAQLRAMKRLTQEELAEKVGVTRQAISKWERGEGLPDLYNIKALSEVLGVRIDELMGEQQTPQEEAPHDNMQVAGNYLKQLLFKAKHTTNSAEAKRIKKLLITVGIAGIVVGVIMIISGFYGFGKGAFDSVNNFPNGNLEPFNPLPYMGLFMLGGVVAGISVYILYGGLGIFIAEVTTKYLDTRSKCPNCGDEIDKDEKVCSSCGYKIEQGLLCSCGKHNQIGDKFCRECGKKL